MNKRLDEMLQLHTMCSRELSDLLENVNWYMQKTNKQAELMKKTWHELSQGGSLAIMSSYDNFVNSITKVMNLSRTLNLFLEYSHTHYQKYEGIDDVAAEETTNENCAEGEEAENQQSIESSIKNLSMEFNNSIDKLPIIEFSEEFNIKRLDLSIYKKHDKILCNITYIEDLEELKFYIMDKATPHQKDIYHLANSLELKQYRCLPPPNEVFGLLLESKIWRAVRSQRIMTEQQTGKKYWPCYLLDTGEIFHLLPDHITFILQEADTKLPALAILCKLKIDNNSLQAKQLLQKELMDLEFKTCTLEIVNARESILQVKFSKPDADVNLNTAAAASPETNPFRKCKYSTDMFSKQDIALLYEEHSMVTSNPMKAVMGYDPQDDRRICRFYDPKTDSCFKGANCKQEHTPLQPDGWTKDLIPAVASINHNITAETIYKPGTIINVTVTSIERFDRFYGQINDAYHVNTPLIWNDEDIAQWKILQKPPFLHDIVLARYEDGLWYRARVVEHDDSYKMFKIFYVDYGNSQHTNLRNLARCDRGQAQFPHQAKLFRLADVKEIEGLTMEDRKAGINVLSKSILNNSFDVKVVQHYEDLYVEFLEDNKLVLVEMKQLGFLQSEY